MIEAAHLRREMQRAQRKADALTIATLVIGTALGFGMGAVTIKALDHTPSAKTEAPNE